MPPQHAVRKFGNIAIAKEPAILAIASGEVLHGVSFGHPAPVTGEVVFNTALTGYQEIVTDPSYQGQLVCMTAPHVGIVGINAGDCEAGKPQAVAMIVRSLSRSVSNWRAQGSLDDYFRQHKIAGITDIDTRKLTHLLRDQGATNGCIMAGNDTTTALQLAHDCQPMAGNDLGATAGRKQRLQWTQSRWDLATNQHAIGKASGPKVAVLDCGAKKSIMQELAARGLQVCVIPYASTPDRIISEYAGLVLSNGPGDPQPLKEAIDLTRLLLQHGLPLFGICLGHEVLAQAAGAKTLKMKFGHHGANHPILELNTGQVFISSQNHGFAVCPASLPSHVEITHTSLFDGSIQGIAFKDKPAISFQGHPEASPGPRELAVLFDRFTNLVTAYAQAH